MIENFANIFWELLKQEGISGLLDNKIQNFINKSPLELRRLFPSFQHKLKILMYDIHQRIIEYYTEKDKEKPSTINSGENFDIKYESKEVLFNMVIDCIDILNPNKKALRNLYYDLENNRFLLVKSLLKLRKIYSLIIKEFLRRNNVFLSGLSGLYKILIIELLFLNILSIWLKNCDSDLDNTMAALDEYLDFLIKRINFSL